MNAGSEGDVIFVASYNSHISCPICWAEDIPSGSAKAFVECGHIFCAVCMDNFAPQPAQRNVQKPRKCPKCNIIRDLEQARKVKFKAAPDDKPEEVKKVQEEYATALATNQQLKIERTRLLAEIEKKRDDHTRLSEMRLIVDRHCDSVRNLAADATQ